MNKKIISTAAFIGMIAILLGAFGAHALKSRLATEQLVTFETGVRYQMYHALFLLFVGVTTLLSEKAKKTIFNLAFLGIIFFSGSIYVLATKALTGFNIAAFGIVTPIGGGLLIGAWGTLFWNVLKSNDNFEKKNSL